MNPVQMLELALFRFEHVYDLPFFDIGAAEFALLPEYSCSLPTGGTRAPGGKLWRRDLFAYQHPSLGGPLWIIGEWGETDAAGRRKIRWYRPSLTPQTALLL